ncbi:MAG: electron transfer flavoprotein subunit beta/FixA family protein [Brevinema sp.]
MKIVVCIKQVPNTAEITINQSDGTLQRDGVASIINPDDLYALEEALKLKDKFQAEITVITMGPPSAETILRESMAMGADNSVMLSDPAFAGSDTYVTSKILSTAIKRLNPDIVFTGKQAIDGSTAQVGSQIAEFLNIPQITYVSQIDSDDGKIFTVYRTLEQIVQIVEVSTPCLFTIIGDINQPRYMGGGYFKPITMISAKDLGLDDSLLGLKGSPTKVIRSQTKHIQHSGQIFKGSPDEAVDRIEDYLQHINLIKD